MWPLCKVLPLIGFSDVVARVLPFLSLVANPNLLYFSVLYYNLWKPPGCVFDFDWLTNFVPMDPFTLCGWLTTRWQHGSFKCQNLTVSVVHWNLHSKTLGIQLKSLSPTLFTQPSPGETEQKMSWEVMTGRSTKGAASASQWNVEAKASWAVKIWFSLSPIQRWQKQCFATNLRVNLCWLPDLSWQDSSGQFDDKTIKGYMSYDSTKDAFDVACNGFVFERDDKEREKNVIYHLRTLMVSLRLTFWTKTARRTSFRPQPTMIASIQNHYHGFKGMWRMQSLILASSTPLSTNTWQKRPWLLPMRAFVVCIGWLVLIRREFWRLAWPFLKQRYQHRGTACQQFP